VIRQAHSYLAGAVSGTALIAAAVVAFVMLISLQALKDWPLAGIGGGGDSAAVSEGQPAAGTTGASGAAGGAAARKASNGANGKGRRQGGADSVGGQQGDNSAAGTPPVGEAPTSNSAGGTAASAPSTSSGSGGGSGGSGSGTGDAGGSGQSTSGAVTGTVNETVSGVDPATGGALGNAGVTAVTEGAVNGAAGPESPVGKTVDKVVETAGGLLGGGK
jgi:hypothetical protein